MMEIDAAVSDHERSTRAVSVLSGMSVEDMEAAETLNSLQQGLPRPKPDLSEYSSPQQKVPVHVHTTTTFDASQPEPLLRLFTSQYPLAGSLLNGSLTAYKTTQSFIPGAEWTERNVGLPIAGKVARISGVEGGLRWVLQPRRDGKSSGTPQTPDVEKGFDPTSSTNQESLPAYSPGDRSPPYTEHEVAMFDSSSSQRQGPPPNWRQQLLVSTSGLGVAMSEESLRSLRYCLSWLRWANGRLGEAIQNLKALLDRYGDGSHPQGSASPMSVASLTTNGNGHQEEQQRQAVAARIALLRREVLETLKKVVGIVSQYAGGALPHNARDLVHRHLMSLPQRFSIANAMSTQQHQQQNGTEGSGQNEAAVNANRVMVLAQEGLDMMTQVSRVVNDTLVSAEGWCEKLGRKGGEQGQQGQRMVVGVDGEVEKGEVQGEQRERSMTGARDGDVKMEM
jgi:transcriptional repressor OPI1